MIHRLDSWQRRVFLLEGDIHDEKWHDPKTDLDYHVRGRLMHVSKKGIPVNTRLVLEGDSVVVLRGMYHRETTRHALERALIMSYLGPPVYPKASIRGIMLAAIHRMDITQRCIRMLQRYPEGWRAGWYLTGALTRPGFVRWYVRSPYMSLEHLDAWQARVIRAGITPADGNGALVCDPGSHQGCS